MAGKALGRGWIAGAVLVVAAYGVGLGGIHAPKVGDEYLYRQIVRVTGESGHWLPLRSEEGITDRKPFLFFWTGLAATDGGHVVTLVRLRAPIVAQTLLLALLVFLWARRLTGRRERGLLAAALFLGFFSTFRYGRTFLTNMPEALFTFAAWFGVWLASEVGLAKAPAAYWRRWLGVGLALGVVLLHRSFVLWLPFFAAAKLFLIGERGGDWRRMAREDGPGLALAFVVSGLCFALWPLLDPQPGEILRTFLLDENMGKVNSGGYLRGLVVGDYNLTRIWLGHLFNAGPLAPLVVALPFVVFRALRAVGQGDWQKGWLRMPSGERALWCLVLAYIAVFTVPSQRSPSYLISGTPAVAVLLAAWWDRLPRAVFRTASGVLALIFGAATFWLALVAEGDLGFAFPLASGAALFCAVGLGMALACTFLDRIRTRLLHWLPFMLYLGLGLFLQPLESTIGRFEDRTIDALRGKDVWVPSTFRARHERYYTLIPGAKIHPYVPDEGGGEAAALLRQGRAVVIDFPLGEPALPPRGAQGRAMGARLDLRTRQNGAEIRKILGGDVAPLFQRETVFMGGS